MTQEEKAKAYDEAIKAAREWAETKNGYYTPKELCEEIFPELKENENDRIRKEIITYLSTVEDKELIPYESWIAWLEKQGEQKLAWSEEDEKMVKDIIAAIDTLHYHGMVNWLKSIKSRISLKQEWSEEEIEKAAQEWESKANFNPFYMTPTGVKQDITSHEESFKAGVNWILKSLRPQNRWKPSDKQMNALDSTLQYSQVSYNSFEHLNSLFNDLKKLREE